MMTELGCIAEVTNNGIVRGVFENTARNTKIRLQPGSILKSITKTDLNEFKKKKFNEYRMVNGKLKGVLGKEKPKKKTKYAALEKRVAKLEKLLNKEK